MGRRSPLALAVAAVILGLAGAPASVGAGTSAEARAEHQRIVRYWTPARMKAAIPRGVERAVPARVPTAKPGGGTSSVTGATWTKGGVVRKSVGKVFFTLGSTNYTCSGSVTQDGRDAYSLVLTAAHCAYDEANDVFATNWLFIPDYQSAPTRSCEDTTYGCWTAQALVVHKGWADEPGFTDEATRHDFAFAVVGPGGKSGSQLDAVVDGFPYSFEAVPKGTRLYAFGYPAAGKYKGTKLVYCAGPVGFDAWNADTTYSLACDMTGGSSGGPWFTGFDDGRGIGTQMSVNSYRYNTNRIQYMFGPRFTFETTATYDAALTAEML
jgi:V8-like Glu-specific endopeptidase